MAILIATKTDNAIEPEPEPNLKPKINVGFIVVNGIYIVISEIYVCLYALYVHK